MEEGRKTVERLKNQGSRTVGKATILSNYLQRLRAWVGDEPAGDASEAEKRMHASTLRMVNSLREAIAEGTLTAQDVEMQNLAMLVMHVVTIKFGKSSPTAALEEQLKKVTAELEEARKRQLELEIERPETQPQSKEVGVESGVPAPGETLEQSFASQLGFSELQQQLAEQNLAIFQQSVIFARGGLPTGLAASLHAEREYILTKVGTQIRKGAEAALQSTADGVWPDLDDNRAMASLRDKALDILESYRLARYLETKAVQKQGVPLGFGLLFGTFWQRFVLPFHSLFLPGGETELMQELTGFPDKSKSSSPAQNPSVRGIVVDGERQVFVSEPFPGPHYRDLTVAEEPLELRDLPAEERKERRRKMLLLRKEERSPRYADALWPGQTLLSDVGGVGETLVQEQNVSDSIFSTPLSGDQLTPAVAAILEHLRSAHLEPGLAKIDETTAGGAKNMSIRQLLLTVIDAVLQIEMTGYSFSRVTEDTQARLIAQLQTQDFRYNETLLVDVSPWKAQSFSGGLATLAEDGRMTLSAMELKEFRADTEYNSAEYYVVSPARLYPQNYFAATYIRAWLESLTNQGHPLAGRDFYSRLPSSSLALEFPYLVNSLYGYHDTAFSFRGGFLPLDLHEGPSLNFTPEDRASTYGVGPDANKVYHNDGDLLVEGEKTHFFVMATSPYALGTTGSVSNLEVADASQAEVANRQGLFVTQQHGTGIYHRIQGLSLMSGGGGGGASRSPSKAPVQADAQAEVSAQTQVLPVPQPTQAHLERSEEQLLSDTDRLMLETDDLLREYADSTEFNSEEDDEDSGYLSPRLEAYLSAVDGDVDNEEDMRRMMEQFAALSPSTAATTSSPSTTTTTGAAAAVEQYLSPLETC